MSAEWSEEEQRVLRASADLRAIREMPYAPPPGSGEELALAAMEGKARERLKDALADLAEHGRATLPGEAP